MFVFLQVSRTIQSDQQYALYISATVGGPMGDIAIDDIRATKGACPPAPFCDFEDGLCGWTYGQDSLNWTMGQNGQVSWQFFFFYQK